MKQENRLFVTAALLTLMATSHNAAAITQTITTGDDAFEVQQGDTISFPLLYSADVPQTTGVGLSLSFDAKKLKFLGFSESFKKDLIAEDTVSRPKENNRDTNTETDATAAIAWTSLSGNWPDEEQQLPITLAVAQFEVLDADDSVTAINITGKAAAQSAFSAEPVSVKIGLGESQLTSVDNASNGGGSLSWFLLPMALLLRGTKQTRKI